MISDETIYKTVDYQKVYSNANELLVSNHVIEMFPFKANKLLQDQSDIRLCSYKKALDKYGVNVKTFGSESAVWQEYEGANIIFYNEREAPYRIRFDIMHEFGHFADLPQKYVTAISKGKGMGETFDKELAAYKDNSTQIQQDYVDYLIHYNYGWDGESEPLKESLGDAEMGVFATDLPLQLRMRLLEFQANFPELIAKFINAYDKQAK